MFEKLTPRERKLAYGVLGLAPAAVLFMVVFWFIGKKGDNQDELQRLTTSIKVEKEKRQKALKANRRRTFYNNVSFPAEADLASNNYQIWLKQLIDELQMDWKSVQPRDAGILKFKQNVLGRRKTYKVIAKGDLQQLTEFLTRFYKVDLLHRINSIKVTPENEVAGKNKKVRSGKLSLSIDIEVLSLDDADDNPEFTNRFRELARADEEYQTGILKRNIFGPANNTPTISVRPSSSYYSGSDARISVNGKDLDENNLVSFEIVDATSIEGEVELVQKDPTDKRASLTIPGQKAGKYPMKLRIFDDGFPAKESFAEFTVVFKDKPPKVVEKKKDPVPPPPPYQAAKQTQITAIIKERDGTWYVLMKVRTSGNKFKVKAGDSFELDDRKWVVESIFPGEITILVDEKSKIYYDGDFLGAPRKEWSHVKPVVKPAEPKAAADLPPLPKVVSQ